MQFVRLGEFFAAARITGPTHNLLQIRLGGPLDGFPICERLAGTGECRHKPLNEDQLVKHVLRGVAEANQHLGSAYVVSHIRYVENDTPPEEAYGFMAMRIVEHYHNGGAFEPGLSTEQDS